MKRMRLLRMSPASTVMGALRSNGMGDILSSIETGVTNDVNSAPNQLLSGLVGSVASQPGVQAAAGSALQQQSASALATQITAIMNNPQQLMLYGGGILLALIVLKKVL